MGLTANPVWAHEFRLTRRRWLRWFGRRWAEWCGVAFACCYVTLLSAATLLIDSVSAQSVAQVVLAAAVVLAPGLGAVSLASERQRGSWALLTTSPLRPSELILGKLAGRALCVLALVLLAVPFAAVLAWATPACELTDLATRAALCVGPVVLGLTGLGLLCSARCRTVTSALLSTYGLAVALMTGWPLLLSQLGYDRDLAAWTWPFAALQPSGNAGHCGLTYLLLATVSVLLLLINFEDWLRLEGEPRRASWRQWRIGLLLPLRQVEPRLRWLWTGSAGFWLLLGLSALAVVWYRLVAEPSEPYYRAAASALVIGVGALALTLARRMPAAPPVVTNRLRARLGVPQAALVLGRAGLLALLMAPLMALAAVPVALRCDAWGDLAGYLPPVLVVWSAVAVQPRRWLRPVTAVLAVAWAVQPWRGDWLDFSTTNHVVGGLVSAGVGLLVAMLPESQGSCSSHRSYRTHGSHATHLCDPGEATP